MWQPSIKKTCQRKDIKGSAYLQIHPASEKCYFSVKINEVSNDNCIIKRCSVCDEVAQPHGPLFHILPIFPKADVLILNSPSIFQPQTRLFSTFIFLSKSQNVRWAASPHSSSFCEAMKSLWMPNFKFLKLTVISHCQIFQCSHQSDYQIYRQHQISFSHMSAGMIFSSFAIFCPRSSSQCLCST